MRMVLIIFLDFSDSPCQEAEMLFLLLISLYGGAAEAATKAPATPSFISDGTGPSSEKPTEWRTFLRKEDGIQCNAYVKKDQDSCTIPDQECTVRYRWFSSSGHEVFFDNQLPKEQKDWLNSHSGLETQFCLGVNLTPTVRVYELTGVRSLGKCEPSKKFVASEESELLWELF